MHVSELQLRLDSVKEEAGANKIKLQVRKHRVTHTLTPVTFRNIETDYGTSTLVIFEDAQRRTFKWFASNCPLAESQQGTPVELTFTIKSHDDWQGRNQTAITRAKIFVPKEKKTNVKK